MPAAETRPATKNGCAVTVVGVRAVGDGSRSGGGL
jgi:DNA transposition AAA+ family ATPase